MLYLSRRPCVLSLSLFPKYSLVADVNVLKKLGSVREGTLFSELHRFLDLLSDLDFKSLERVFREDRVLNQPRLESRDRVQLPPLVDLPIRTVDLRISLVVPVVSVGL